MATLTTSYQLIASKYIGTTTASTTKNLYLRIYAKYTSQSVAENKSYVSYKSTLYVEGGGTYFYTGNYTTKTLSGTGATSVSADAQGNYYIGETTLSEISGVVSHGSEGTASVSITAGWVSTPWEINGSLTGTASLPTIARATTPTLSTTSTTMGWNVTITLKPANSTFKHKLRYDFGGSTGNADGMSVGWDFTPAGNTTVTFTPPTSLSKQIPTADSANCSIICYTYLSNGTHVGTKTVNLTVSVPVYSPTIKSVALTGSNLLSGAYVQGKSKVSGAVEAGTSYNAYIKSISSTVDGKTYTGSPFTSGVLSNGSKTVETTVTDSRGKTAIFITPSFTVYGYSAPTITNFTLERQGDGSTVTATVKGSVSAVNNKNAKNITVTLNGVTQTITSSSYTINGTTTFTNVPTDSTFTSTAKIADSYTNVTKDAVLPTIAVTMDFYKDGNGVAFGKVAEQGNLLDIAWNVKNNSIPTLLGGFGKPIPNGANINTIEYITPGNYVCALNDTAKTLVNSPTTSAFNMQVSNCLDTWTDVQTGNYMYLIRKITNLDGNIWVQYVRKEGADWHYTSWRMIIDTGSCRDYVIEQGISNDWNYVKWNNGKSEAWRKVELGDVPLTTSLAGGVYSNTSYNGRGVTLPSGLFTTIPLAFANVYSNGYTHCQVASATNTQVVYRLWSPYSATISGVIVSLYVVGRWK